MSKRVKTRVVLEFDSDEELRSKPALEASLTAWYLHSGTTITEISREPVKGEKTERQVYFEKKLKDFRRAVAICSGDIASAYLVAATAIEKEIDRMEGER